MSEEKVSVLESLDRLWREAHDPACSLHHRTWAARRFKEAVWERWPEIAAAMREAAAMGRDTR